MYSELLLAAELLGLSDQLKAQFQESQPSVLQRMERGLPGVPAKARRWVSEMQEIEATFADVGLTPYIFRGVTDMYRLIGDSPLGEETPENKDRERNLEETIRLIADSVRNQTG